MLLVPRPVVADAEMTTRSPFAGTRPPTQLPGVDHELFAPPPIQMRVAASDGDRREHQQRERQHEETEQTA